MKIVHLARDEKFIPLLRKLFEDALPGCNRWLVAKRWRAKPRFVQPAPDVVLRDEWLWRTPLITRDVADADVIVAHSMTGIFASAIGYARPRARVVWLGWGYDYYPLLMPLLGEDQGLEGDDLAPTGFASGGWRWLLPAGRKQLALERMASRIHSYCVLPSEVPLLQRVLPELRLAHPHELPLFTAEDVFARGPQQMSGPDILLGNSATGSNHHEEALRLLQGRIPAETKCVVPLSYGNTRYGAQIAALGEQLFGSQFEGLRQWMSLDDYNQRIQRCGFVVMNHRRQQAVGNVGAALYKGATVYLREENPMLTFYRGIGVRVRTMSELREHGLKALEPEALALNRTRMASYYGRDSVIRQIRTLPALTR